MFRKQCKATDFSAINLDKIPKNGWYVSTKYDGNYVQIHKYGDTVKFFTSGGEEFYLPNTARELVKANASFNFVCEAEYIAHTQGAKGDRVHAAKLTTYRTEFKKGITSNDILEYNQFKIFDLLQTTVPGPLDFEGRHTIMSEVLKPTSNITVVNNLCSMSFIEAQRHAKNLIKSGMEGAIAKHSTHMYLEGKRVKNAIKLKYRPSADLICISIIYGEEGKKYEGLIGSLLLQDSTGRKVAVGSGLPDNLRKLSPAYFIGKVIEIEYEQILNTYIQPVFIGIRENKEID